MFFLQKKLAVLVLVAGTIFATGCASVGGGGNQDALNDVLTERSVIRALSNEPELTGDPILVTCVDGKITLSGSVDNAVDIELAERVAKGVPGVTTVNNALRLDS